MRKRMYLIPAACILFIMFFTVFGSQFIVEFVVESLGIEVPFFCRHPFMKPHVRCNDELCHVLLVRLQ